MVFVQNGNLTVRRTVDVQVTSFDMAINGAADVLGWHAHSPLLVTFEPAGELDAAGPSRVASPEHIMQPMEVETGRGEGQVEELALAREGGQLASTQPPRRSRLFARWITRFASKRASNDGEFLSGRTKSRRPHRVNFLP